MAEEGDDTEALLRDAQRLPWEARLTHAHWAVRVQAYGAVTAAAAAAGDINASPLSDFGALSPRRVPSCAFLTRGAAVAGAVSNKAASDGNAPALDAGLEALVAFLARADEEYASRCVARARARRERAPQKSSLT